MNRIITHTAKPGGTIRAVAGITPNGRSWKPCSRDEAVADDHSYFVARPDDA